MQSSIRNSSRPRRALASVAIVASLALAGCGAQAGTSGSESGQSAQSAESGESTGYWTAVAITSTDELADATHYDADDTEYSEDDVTDIALSGSTVEASGADADTVEVTYSEGEAVVTISGTGTYRLSGELTGQVVIASDDQSAVQLILNGVNITSGQGAALHSESADEVTVIVADGTDNTLADASSRPSHEDDLNYDTNAALFSRTDLTLAGTGSLNVTGNYDDAIHVKDGLVINGPTIVVSAVDDGIIGKDYLVLVSGDVDITSTDTGFGSDNDEDADRGWLSVLDGTLTVSTGDDGVKSENALAIAGGSVTVTQSEEGIESADITIAGGDIDIVSGDDGINASGGYGTTSTSDAAADPMAADGAMSGGFGGGEQSGQGPAGMTPPEGRGGPGGQMGEPPTGDAPTGEPPEGMTEGEAPTRGMPGGTDGQMSGGMGGGMAGGMDAAGPQMLTITGGTVTVNAGGDGLDSNGSIAMTGGGVTIFGPENDGNGAIDFAGSFDISGGTLLAVGSSGMAEAPDPTSAQASISVALDSTMQAGEALTIVDTGGTVVGEVVLEKTAAHVVFSSPDVVAGETYTVYQGGSGGTEVASTVAGEYTNAMMGGGGGMGAPGQG